MEELLKSPAIQQVPALALMVIVVVVFVKYIQSRDGMMADMHRDHLDARAESRQAIQATSVAMQASAEATRDNIHALKELRESVRDMRHL